MSAHQWNALDYEKNSSQQQLWGQELIAKLSLQGDEAVLDVGCGDGKLTAEIAARVPGGRVLGVDVSPEMIGLANQRYPAQQYPNLRFQVMDASRLTFEREFTTVFSNAALHWVKDHRPVLAGIAASLRPGGKILLQMGGQGNAAQIIAASEAVKNTPGWSTWFGGFSSPYGFYSPEEYRPWLAEAGLRPLRVELIPKENVQAGREGLVGWLRTTHLAPYLQRLPEDRRPAFLDRVIDAYLEQNPIGPDGKVRVRMVRLEVEAQKYN